MFIKPDISESEGLAILNNLHGGGGKFRKNIFQVAGQGLSLAGPLGWQTSTQTGVSEFCGEWLAKNTGSFMRVRGIERSNSAWNDRAMVEWVRRWFILNQRSLNGLQKRCKLKRHTLDTQAGQLKGVRIDYDFTPSKAILARLSGTGKSLGQLVLIPKGKLLIVVNAVANPGKEQQKTLATLAKHIASLRLD